MRVAIFGGNGFVGTSLKSALAVSGKEAVSIDLVPEKTGIESGFPFECGDIRDYESIASCAADFEIDVLINLAAEHRDDVLPLERYHDTNVKGSENVCAFARERGVNTIVFTSSVAVYGFAAPNTGEDGPINFFNEYGKTKYLAEQKYLEWQQEEPAVRTLVIVRPTVIFGPGNRGNVYTLLRQISTRRFAMFGNGLNVKSLAYVDNVAAFLEHCCKFEPGVHLYNYVDKPDLAMNSLVGLVRKILFGKHGVGLRLPAFLGITIGMVFDLLSCVTRKRFAVSRIRVRKFLATTQFSSAVGETAFSPSIELEDGLKKTLIYEFVEANEGQPTFDTE